MSRARFLDIAELELAEAFDWYEEQQIGLGKKFSIAVRETVAKILRDPESHALMSDSIRRRRVLKFPYDVLFAISEFDVIVIGIMHHQRSPNSWTDRWPEG